jgi:hypothetical protein
VLKRPPATAVSPFSAYLIGFILGFLLSFSADARWSTGAAYLMHTKFIKTVLMPRSLEFASLILLLPVRKALNRERPFAGRLIQNREHYAPHMYKASAYECLKATEHTSLKTFAPSLSPISL